MLNTQKGKQFAYELTIEYIHQNNLLKCLPEEIPNQIKTIAKVTNLICESLEKEYHNIAIL